MSVKYLLSPRLILTSISFISSVTGFLLLRVVFQLIDLKSYGSIAYCITIGTLAAVICSSGLNKDLINSSIN